MMYKLREWLVSGTFFSVICLFSTIVSVGWGLAANTQPTTYAAVEEIPSPSDNWFLHAAAKTELAALGGLQALPSWDKLNHLYGLSSTSVINSTDILLAAADDQNIATDKPLTDKDTQSTTSTEATVPVKATTEQPAQAANTQKVDKPVQVASAAPTFLIYHTHNRESYYPELKAGAKDASSKTVNVTQVGKRLAASLEKLGLPSIHQTTDYPTTVTKFNYAYSYKYSKQTVVEALKDHKELTYLFDIHRDSQKRNKTTIEINGKAYAKILFVIGERNPNWKENKAFALKLHEALNAKYPGISRGVLSKGPGTGNAEYNQSLSPGSLVIEMGGVDNTLEESYRTADALAAVMKELVV
ncbi:stage II sporulation protein P [Paenibacillus sp. strain BS8-2]